MYNLSGPPHMWIVNHQLSLGQGFELQVAGESVELSGSIENNLHISGPLKFKPLLFKGQL